MSNVIIFNNKTVESVDARDTILKAEDTNTTTDNRILLPDVNLNYDDKTPNSNRTITDPEETTNQYLIASTHNLNDAVSGEYTEYFLNYNKNDNSIKWKGNKATGKITNVEENSRKVIPIEDFNTNVQFNTLGRTHEDSSAAVNKHSWVSLHASVSDIGLKQATWNINEEYIYHNNSNPSESSDVKPLKVNFFNSNDNNSNLRFTISYLKKNSEKIQISTNIKVTDNVCVKTENTQTNNVNDTSGQLECYKIIGVEITQYGEDTLNRGTIEFYFEESIDTENDNDGGITKLEVDERDADNNFQYNCNYLNCQYLNNFYNRNILSRASGSPVEFTKTGNTAGTLYDLIKTHYDTNIGNFDNDMYGSGDNVILELEGGEGRKTSIKLDKDKKFYIENPGYLYKKNDLLRFKDPRLRDTVIFKVNEVGNADATDTKFIQEVISRGHSKSNTIKYSLGKKDSLVIKNLTISGGVKSDIIVRLIHIKDIFSTTPIQYTLKEFYYYERTNIHEIHNLNLFIDKSEQGNEIFIDLQKIVKDSDDMNEKNTLNISLNGIKFTDS